MDKEALRKLIEDELVAYGLDEDDASELSDSITEIADENGLFKNDTDRMNDFLGNND